MNFLKIVRRSFINCAELRVIPIPINGPLVIVVPRRWPVLRAVESSWIDLLRIRRVGISRLLLRIDRHQILQIELFFLLAFASEAHGGAGEENGGDELASDGGPCDDV